MKKKSIVIVEDNSEDCSFLVEALKIIGVKNPLKCFDEATKALNYLRSGIEMPFLIISDINMPMMNGLEFKKAINADKNPGLKQIPFIFLSTLDPSHYAREIEALSIQAHFKKPRNFNELIHILRSIIESWERVDAMAQ